MTMLARTIVASIVVALSSTAHAEIINNQKAKPSRSAIEQAKAEVKLADIDFKLARFGEALDKYARAYELYPVPGLLFNIGQCHRLLKHHAKAIFFFEGYLRDEPAASNRPLVEDLIREARAALDKPAEVLVQPPTPQPPTPQPPLPVAPLVVQPAQEPEAPQQDGAPSRVIPSLLVGGGLAVAATGGAFYYYGQKRGPDEKYVYRDTRTLGGVMMAAGGAAIVAGAIVWLRRPSSAPVAGITPDGAYLGWAGAF
jgi:tetratricopeptide (TPR) repeat protein